MPKRSSTDTDEGSRASSKRGKSGASVHALAAADAPAAAAGGSGGGDKLPLDKWRVVLTGDFVVRSREALERALGDRGVAVTGSVSGRTTHLVLGSSGRNEYGRATGSGSKKHRDATAMGLPVLTERDIWDVLNGTVRVRAKATKSSRLTDKVVHAVQETGEHKVSLARLKKELAERYGMDFGRAANKTNLRKALGKCVEEGRLVKDGASYTLSEPTGGGAVDGGGENGHHAGPGSDDDGYDNIEEKIRRLAPMEGRWRGLYILSTTKSKSGRARCGVCEEVIAKGETQVQVSDDSLFKMLVFPGDDHEGVGRGYVECGFPGFEVVSRRKFFVHESCQEEAEEKCRAQFQADWRRVRPHVMLSLESM